jgi:hypothetical protein
LLLVSSRCLRGLFFNIEDGPSMFLRNVGRLLAGYMESHCSITAVRTSTLSQVEADLSI